MSDINKYFLIKPKFEKHNTMRPNENSKNECIYYFLTRFSNCNIVNH